MNAEKLNIVWLAKHHRKHCEGEDCNVSLLTLMMTAEKAGISFTRKEMKVFI